MKIRIFLHFCYFVVDCICVIEISFHDDKGKIRT